MAAKRPSTRPSRPARSRAALAVQVEEIAHREHTFEQKIRRDRAGSIVNTRMWWTAGIGLLPLPVVDWAATTAVQVAMINELATLYTRSGQPPVTAQTARKWIASLAGGFVPTYLKAVPLFGLTVGLLTGPLFYGAMTYAIGHVFVQHFETGGTLLTFDADKMRAYFETFLLEGKERLRRQQAA
jgi:uncharacterized protein (DUF697 family)